MRNADFNCAVNFAWSYLGFSSDVGLALIKYNPTFKKMNQKDKSQFLDEFEG